MSYAAAEMQDFTILPQGPSGGQAAALASAIHSSVLLKCDRVCWLTGELRIKRNDFMARAGEAMPGSDKVTRRAWC